MSDKTIKAHCDALDAALSPPKSEWDKEVERKLEEYKQKRALDPAPSASAPDGQKSHKTITMLVWADIDEGIAEVVRRLNEIPGVRTQTSCQGTTEEGGPHPYRGQVMCTWTDAAYEILSREFDITILGDHWGYIHPYPAREKAEQLKTELFAHSEEWREWLRSRPSNCQAPNCDPADAVEGRCCGWIESAPEMASAALSTRPAPAAGEWQRTLREARQFVSDAGDDEDPDAARGSRELLERIDTLLASSPSPGEGQEWPCEDQLAEALRPFIRGERARSKSEGCLKAARAIRALIVPSR